ncbi:MAG: kelch repeat-containing protein [Polyangiales bacterium]
MRLCRRGGWAVPLLGSWLACEPAPDVSTLPLQLRSLAACELGPPSALEITALGDFPSRTVRVAPNAASTAFESLPWATVELDVRATGERASGVGRHVRTGAAGEQPMWLLPEQASCPLFDALARALEGAAVVALPPLASGSPPLPAAALLIAGGREAGPRASSEALLLPFGSEAAAPVPDGMLLRRALASATVLGDVVVVAGGTADFRGSAHDTYEVLEVTSQRFVAARSGGLATARMQHTALALSDDRVLLVGGRVEAEGAPLATAELIDLRAMTSELLEGDRGLSLPRSGPISFSLDSGSKLVLAGRDEAGNVLGSIERFDPVTRRFTRVIDGLPQHAEVVAAALPGARVAWLGCDYGQGARCMLWVLSETADGFTRSTLALPFDTLAPAGLSALSLLAMGRDLLLTGADDSDPNLRRRAFVIDVARPSLTPVDASRVPTHLVSLAGGAIAEIDAAGTSLRAAPTWGRFASPTGDLIIGDSPCVALDVPEHWQRGPAGLEARSAGARLDLAELRFQAFELTLGLVGEAALIFYDGDSTPYTLTIDHARDTPGACSLPPDADVQVSRSGSRLQVSNSGAADRCTLEVGNTSLGVGVGAAAGSVIRSLRVERR